MGSKIRLEKTPVETSVAASSTNQALRIPTKSVVWKTTSAKSTSKQAFYNINLFGLT